MAAQAMRTEIPSENTEFEAERADHHRLLCFRARFYQKRGTRKRKLGGIYSQWSHSDGLDSRNIVASAAR
jgi:hypothetical protein